MKHTIESILQKVKIAAEQPTMRYYYDAAGDYLAVDHKSRKYYESIGQPRMREARAAAIYGSVSSVCTTSVSLDFLHECCTPIKRAAVPREWLAMF